MESRVRAYNEWLAGRQSDSMVVDNSRANIINMAMESGLQGNWRLFNLVIVTDQEAVEWMFNHVPTLESISNPRVINVLIEMLQSEIGYVNRVAAEQEPSDGHRRPTIGQMNELIRGLKSGPLRPALAAPAPASASAAPASASAAPAPVAPAPASASASAAQAPVPVAPAPASSVDPRLLRLMAILEAQVEAGTMSDGDYYNAMMDLKSLYDNPRQQGGFPRRIKNSKKSKKSIKFNKSIKSNKSRKSRKCRRH